MFLGWAVTLPSTELKIVENDLRAISEKVTSATVRISTLYHESSGTLITSNGFVLTIKDRLTRGNEVSVLLADGKRHVGKVAATWPYYGMALVKIDTTNAPFVPLGDSRMVEVGDQVISVGNAFNSSSGRATRCAVNYGIISSRTTMETDKVFFTGKVFTTDARINKGQEGGGVVDFSGHLIAINGEAVLSNQTNAFVSVALPIEGVMEGINSHIKNELPVVDGRQKIVGITLDDRSLLTGGIKVHSISKYASQGGVKKGDLILKVAGQEVNNLFELDAVVMSLSLNRLVEVKVYRKSKVLTRYVVLQESMPINSMLLSEAYRNAVDKVSPSVVRISFEKTSNETSTALHDPNSFQLGHGPFTGVVYRRDGYIMTTSFIFPSVHEKIIVELFNGKKYVAKKLGEDTGRNITLLKIEADDLIVPKFVSKEQVGIGSTILSLGRTFGENIPEVSRGIVSALNRSAGKAIQIDSNLTPGNFGGPSIDLDGQIIGINIPQANIGSGRRGGTVGGEFSGSGIGFVIPCSDIDLLFNDLKNGKKLEPAFLGISFDLNANNAKITRVIEGAWFLDSGLEKTQQNKFHELNNIFMKQGLRFTVGQFNEFKKVAVKKNTGAWTAGLRKDDVIVEFNGQKIVSYNMLMNVIGRLNSGESVTFKVKRFGIFRDVKAVLGSRGLVLR